MLNSAFLDTIIAFAFVFAGASAACSALFETFSSLLGLRGLLLKKTITAMLGNQAGAVTAHPALQALKAGLWGFPSYVDPQLFGEIVYSKFATLNAANLPTTNVDPLKPFFATATSPSGAVLNLAAWFTACTDRTSGAYRRWSQLGLAIFALPFCYFLPIDAIAVTPTPTGPINLMPFVTHSEGIMGIALAAFAISIGASFWFDLAKNLLRLNPRQAGPVPNPVLDSQ